MSDSKGTFYLVSTGPGDPELMTLKAVRILSSSKVIFCPVTASDKKTTDNVSFDTVKSVVDCSDKTLRFFEFTMERDPSQALRTYERAGDECISYLDQGMDAAFISIGDVSLYSTAGHVASYVKAKGYKTEYIPGVNSFSASACECNIDLASRNSPVSIIPGDAFIASGKIEKALDEDGTKIVMKTHRYFADLINILKNKNILDRCYLVQRVSMPEQKVYHGDELCFLSEDVVKNSYLSVVIILEKN